MWLPPILDENPPMLTQVNLNSFITYNPISLSAEMNLVEAVMTLAQAGLHHCPFIDADRRFVGVLSDKEITRVLAQRTPMPTAEDSADNQVDELSVADTMSTDVNLVMLDESPQQVLTRLLEHGLTWLPVGEDETVVGVTTTTDFLREFSYGQIGFSKMRVSELMVPAEVICSETSLQEASGGLREPSDCLSVVRGDFPLGVLSRRDVRLAICRVFVREWLSEQPEDYEFEVSGPRTVLELVSAAPTIRPGASLQDAATLMLDHRRQAIAVVNQVNRMMGAVTEHGILQRMREYLN
jgi:CBS-domain-containing membrane protein